MCVFFVDKNICVRLISPVTRCKRNIKKQKAGIPYIFMEPPMWKGSRIYLYEKKRDKSRHTGGYGGGVWRRVTAGGLRGSEPTGPAPPELRPPPTCFLLLSSSVPKSCAEAYRAVSYRCGDVDCPVKYALTRRHINSSALGPGTGDDLQATCSQTQIYCPAHRTPPPNRH